MLKRSIHAFCSTNWNPASWTSKPVYRGMVTRNPASAPTSATQRCSGARWSPPSARTSTPARIGSQMAKVRSTLVRFFLVFQEPESEDDHADQHAEGVLVDEAALEQAHHAREPPHQARAAVHDQAVDHGLVAGAPEALAEVARAGGEEPGVELVEAELALD